MWPEHSERERETEKEKWKTVKLNRIVSTHTMVKIRTLCASPYEYTHKTPFCSSYFLPSVSATRCSISFRINCTAMVLWLYLFSIQQLICCNCNICIVLSCSVQCHTSRTMAGQMPNEKPSEQRAMCRDRENSNKAREKIRTKPNSRIQSEWNKECMYKCRRWREKTERRKDISTSTRKSQ